MTGFVILPDHPASEPVAVEPAPDGGLLVTIGHQSATLTKDERLQLMDAILRTVER